MHNNNNHVKSEGPVSRTTNNLGEAVPQWKPYYHFHHLHRTNK